MIIYVTDLPVPEPALVERFERLIGEFGMLHEEYEKQDTANVEEFSRGMGALRDLYRQEIIESGYPLLLVQAEMLRIMNFLYTSPGDHVSRLAERWAEAMFTVEEAQAWMIAGVMASGHAATLRMRGITCAHIYLCLDKPHTCSCGLPTMRAALNGGGAGRRCSAYLPDLLKTCLELGSSAFE